MKKYLNKSMVDYVLEQEKIFLENKNIFRLQCYWNIYKYANALSKTPRLGHFIPCDENDVPLSSPIEYSGMDSDAVATVKYYQQACDRVLFEGFKLFTYKGTIYIEGSLSFFMDIERLPKLTYEKLLKHNLPLTYAGAKFFGYDRPQ